MSIDYTKAYRLIVPFEGVVNHMYLDTVGLVTVGVGNMLPTPAAARMLAFVHNYDLKPATPQEITMEFDVIHDQPKGRKESFYKAYTKLKLTDLEIVSLFNKRVDDFVESLTHYYKHFRGYPETVQLAMLDMAFNLGAFALANRWPKLNAAINAGDWQQAAVHSLRPQSHDARNEAIKNLFLSASGVGNV